MSIQPIRLATIATRGLLLIGLILWSCFLKAETSGIISGRLLDKATGETIIGAVVQLEGTDKGTTTDIEGNFRLTVAPGNYTLSLKYIGYTPASMPIEVKANDVVKVEYAMEVEDLALQEVVVVGKVERSGEVGMNLELKKASLVASGITAAEVRRSPDRTVGDILKRVTGASIQDGKFVIIRGMNDRYNAGYLDGSFMSSTESDRKAFAFDVIPASLIDNLMILKSGSPDLTGDFGGGVIKINTKSVPDKLTQSISIGGQYHSLTTNKNFNQVKLYQGEGLNINADERGIPEFEENGLRPASSTPTSQEKEQFAEISKTFNNDWAYSVRNPGPNGRFGYSLGFPLRVGNSGNLGVILALNYANTLKATDSEINTYDGSGQVSNFHDFTSLRNINTGGILNLNYVGPKTQVSFHNLLNSTSDFNYVYRTGTGNFSDALTVQNTANILTTNQLYNGIISFKQLIRDSLLTVNASISYSTVNRDIPDYRIAGYTATPDFPNYRLTIGDFFNSSSGRFYSAVDEQLTGGNLELAKKFTNTSLRTEIKLGGFLQHREREFGSRNFVYKGAPDELTLDPVIDLGQNNIDASRLYLVEKTSVDLAYYTGEADTRAVYLSANQVFGGKLKALYGIRVEDFDLAVDNNKTNQSIAKINETSILPSINLTYYLNEKTNIRASYFSSVNRPEFRELAPFSFYNFDKNAEIRGLPTLVIADLKNVDFRYEIYPDGSQMISLGGFYKHIDNPIELSLDVSQPFTTFTYQNEKSAEIYGLEVELKKRLDFIRLGGFFKDVAVYGNFSLIKSTLEFKEGSQAKAGRPLQGQSPYIINARLQYENRDNGWSANIAFNQVGRRIAYVGVDPTFGDTRQDIFEAPRSIIDAQVAKTIGALNIKFTLGDILHNDLIYYQDANQDGKYTETSAPTGPNDRLMYIYNAGLTGNLALTFTF
ncbi:MAG TPA: TonB-dependent receptor [Saprospiraceae bacterium]